jgi:hypothetical protein
MNSMAEAQTLQITLQPDGVAAPAHRVVLMASQVVGTCLRALEVDNCVEPLSWGGTFGYQFKELDLTPDERRESFKNWVLAKGFQDLARGVRETLEEGLFFIRMSERPSGVVTTLAAVEADMMAIRSSASKLAFPALIEQVNAGLREPMAFDAEFRSLQNVRNCLEHRGGRVAAKDVDPITGTLTLSFPRLKAFYMRGDEEIELAPGEVIDTYSPDGPLRENEEVSIYLRRVTRSREYALNEPIVIGALDFYEIALACHLFASDLASKLPCAPGIRPGPKAES